VRGPAANSLPSPVAPDPEPSGAVARAAFLQKALAAAGAVVLGASFAAASEPTDASAQTPKDDRILNFLLLLQYIEAGFYAAATSRGHLRAELRHFAQVAGTHEREHVAALKSVLGSAARPKPSLRFDGSIVSDGSKFVTAAVLLEEQTISACVGEAAHLGTDRIATVAKLLSVDARHAAWIRDVARRLPAPLAADKAAGPARVLAAMRGAGLLPRGSG
jgi:hypothetical protein